jgi:hypothetical protein
VTDSDDDNLSNLLASGRRDEVAGPWLADGIFFHDPLFRP